MRFGSLHELLELFGQEQACYTSLLDMSRRQRRIIEGGDVDELLVVLGQKQDVLARVSDIEQKLRPYKNDWPSVHGSLDDNDRQVLDMALSTVEELLAELIALEKECEKLLLERRDDAARRLEEAARGSAVHQTYATAPEPPKRPTLDVKTDG